MEKIVQQALENSVLQASDAATLHFKHNYNLNLSSTVNIL